MSYTLGFIGAGNMAEAIARGAADQGVIDASRMIAADPSEARRQVFASFGVATANDNAAVLEQSDTLMLAVKPQMLPQLGEALAAVRDDQVVISIMAGLGSGKLEAAAGKPLRVVRVMPNTPLMIGQGMAGVALGAHAQPGDDALAMELFGACGRAIRVAESDLDAVTAVSGSGPAYLFYLAEAMQQAAAEFGLSEHARTLVVQTLLGSAALLDQSDEAPAELRRKVTSPGGTTEAAIRHLDDHAVRAHVAAALRAARDRSVELGA